MINKKYSFFKNGVKHSREILEEFYQYGRRFYLVKDLNNLDAEPSSAVADDVDKYFKTSKGEIRKNKYSDRAFQKTKAKAGGF